MGLVNLAVERESIQDCKILYKKIFLNSHIEPFPSYPYLSGDQRQDCRQLVYANGIGWIAWMG